MHFIQLLNTRLAVEQIAAITQVQVDYYSPQHPMPVGFKFGVQLTAGKPIVFSFKSESTAKRVHQALLELQHKLLLQLNTWARGSKTVPTISAVQHLEEFFAMQVELRNVQVIEAGANGAKTLIAYESRQSTAILTHLQLTEEELAREEAARAKGEMSSPVK